MLPRSWALSRAALASLSALFFASALFAATPGPGRHATDIALIDRALAKAKVGDKRVMLGDCGILISDLQTYRSRLVAMDSAAPTASGEGSAGAQGFSPLVVTTSSITLWTGGVVNYEFDPAQVSSGTITPAMQTQFKDAVAEWTAAAKLTFVQYSGTQTLPANYVDVQVSTTIGEGGQSSAVGMGGGEQFIEVSPNAWNRGTLCHEVGHALGLFHEQQRSDRDKYVTINFSNIPSGDQGNFVELPGSTNIGPYDFYSVMEYSQFADAITPTTPTIAMKPGYTQYASVIGAVYDRTLSTLDRAGMATMYGNPTATPSNLVTNANDSGPGSLRTALYYAIDQSAKGTPTTITFNIPKTDPGYSSATGVFTISPAYLLPSPGNGTTIDGTTEQSFTGTNTNPGGGPSILINGSVSKQAEAIGAGYQPALILRTANCTVRGLIINGYDVDGLDIMSSTALGTVATTNTVTGCYIGTDSTGTVAVPNAFAGIGVFDGAYNNTIGGTTAAARNLISGNTGQGIYVHDAGTTGNLIAGNYIGTAVTGTAALPNGFAGIEVALGAQANTIGGTTAGARNVLSGNILQGVYAHDAGTTGNLIEGNYVGLASTGTSSVPNSFAGVEIGLGAQANTIGGTTAAARNVLSGNILQGVLIDGSGTTGNLVEGNYIGTNATGTVALGNGTGNPAKDLFYAGVNLYNGAQNNIIGGTASGAGNVIAGNIGDGVTLSSGSFTCSNNIVQGNTIGLSATGTATMGNGSGDPVNHLFYAGVDLFSSAQNNLIGGTATGAGNVISGNVGSGINLNGAGTTGNVVQGNLIGTNSTGVAAIANGNASSPNFLFAGVTIFGGAQSNVIGGTTSSARNVISGNAAQGVILLNAATTSNVVEGNYIGTNLAGTGTIANNQGIGLYSSASSNTIGGAAAGAGNLVSGNTGDGITLSGTDSGQTVGPTQNVLTGNLVGVNSTGTAALANGGNGFGVYVAAQSNTIGGSAAGARNVIWDNSGTGVFVGNYDNPTIDTIKDSLSENSMSGNASGGIFLYQGANNSQAAPSLTTAVTGTTSNLHGTTITGSLTSAASTAFRIELFASPSGGTQGQTFIGVASVTTNASGTGSFTAALTGVGVPSGQVITATANDPNGNTSIFSTARTVTGSLTSGLAQTLTFPPIANQPFNAGSVALNATATSGLAVSYSVTGGSSVASVTGNVVSITGSGTITVQASQAGNASYSAATAVTQTFTATTGSQTISFPVVASTTFGATPITLAATDSAGLMITYQLVSGPATISGNVLSITGAGTVVVQAIQSGTSNYGAAINVSQSFTVRQSTQTITFPTIPTQASGAQVALNAAASSGSPVVYTVISGPATVSGSTLTTTGTGTVTVEANQSGNVNYFAAAAADQTFQVVASLPSNPTDTPTMPQWALILLAALLALAGLPRRHSWRDPSSR